MQSPSFQNTREKALDRDNHECQFCGVTNEQHEQEHGRGLDVHHIIPSSAGGSDRVENLISVCRDCHQTLEQTQGDALKRLSQDHDPQGLIQTIHELERYLRDPGHLAKHLSYENVEIEVVTEHIGTKSIATTDSEKAKEEYDDWGDQLKRYTLSLNDEAQQVAKGALSDFNEHGRRL